MGGVCSAHFRLGVVGSHKLGSAIQLPLLVFAPFHLCLLWNFTFYNLRPCFTLGLQFRELQLNKEKIRISAKNKRREDKNSWTTRATLCYSCENSSCKLISNIYKDIFATEKLVMIAKYSQSISFSISVKIYFLDYWNNFILDA